MIDGVLNVNKEAGATSHTVVSRLRRTLGQRRIGHMGTLDPEARGVLPVCLGRGTRLTSMLQDTKKSYVADLLLGVETDTQDMTGCVVAEREVSCTRQEVLAAVHSFLGEQMQIPPMYSAIKVNGRHLYELAREGRTVERQPRPVCFYEIELLHMELPRLRLRVVCSSGTYIRTLCHDLGKKLGCGGAMESLVRIGVGRFQIEDSFTLQEIENYVRQGSIQEIVIGVEDILCEYPSFHCQQQQDVLLHNGNPLPMGEGCGAQGRFRTYDSAGNFIAVYEARPGQRSLYPVKMFF